MFNYFKGYTFLGFYDVVKRCKLIIEKKYKIYLDIEKENANKNYMKDIPVKTSFNCLIFPQVKKLFKIFFKLVSYMYIFFFSKYVLLSLKNVIKNLAFFISRVVHNCFD